MSTNEDNKSVDNPTASTSSNQANEPVVSQLGDPHLEVSRITVKAPPFWKANPALWFCQLEANFEMNRITSDKSRYFTVVAAIESNVLNQVSDLVLNPPATGLYTALKSRLLDVFVDSEQSRMKKLLGEIVLGDQKPSYLLREMRSLAGNSITADILKTLWLQRLPPNMQAILSISNENLDLLVVMADKIYEATSFTEIHKVSMQPKDNSVESQIVELTRQVSELRASCSFQNRNSRNSKLPRSRSQTPNRSYKQNLNSKSSESKLCWYHSRWGEKARDCVGNCNYKSDNKHKEN